jgi:hypothetical protein
VGSRTWVLYMVWGFPSASGSALLRIAANTGIYAMSLSVVTLETNVNLSASLVPTAVRNTGNSGVGGTTSYDSGLSTLAQPGDLVLGTLFRTASSTTMTANVDTPGGNKGMFTPSRNNIANNGSIDWAARFVTESNEQHNRVWTGTDAPYDSNMYVISTPSPTTLATTNIYRGRDLVTEDAASDVGILVA